MNRDESRAVLGFPQLIPKKVLLAKGILKVLGLQPRFHRFRSTRGGDGSVSTTALCFQLERKLG
jgi:hypothetical protein